jgi:hypothetical protein
MDELAFPDFYPSINYDAVLHPFLFIWERVVRRYVTKVNENLKHRITSYVEIFKNR